MSTYFGDGRPCFFASRIIFTAAAVDMWNDLPPVYSQIRRSRFTINSSAKAGIPFTRDGRRNAFIHLTFTGNTLIVGKLITREPIFFAYCIALNSNPESLTGRRSSVNATAPAFFMSYISVISFPSRFTDKEPVG